MHRYHRAWRLRFITESTSSCRARGTSQRRSLSAVVARCWLLTARSLILLANQATHIEAFDLPGYRRVGIDVVMVHRCRVMLWVTRSIRSCIPHPTGQRWSRRWCRVEPLTPCACTTGQSVELVRRSVKIEKQLGHWALRHWVGWCRC